MKIDEIVINSVIYPFLDLKKFFILGILVLISTLYNIPHLLGIQNMLVTVLLVVIGFLFSLLTQGYTYRNLKYSLEDISKPPEFKNWTEMFKDGIKVFVVITVYFIPAILFLVLSNIVIVILYLIIVVPIIAIAITFMANNDSKFTYAFKLREIINKIGVIGWGKLIKWYIANGIILLILSFIVVSITLFLIKINSIGIGLYLIFLSLIFAPYIYLYISRSIALFYKSDGRTGYLICDKCGGHYELQPGESSEDYEECECGGKLNYSALLPPRL
jgi:hypothetical protein